MEQYYYIHDNIISIEYSKHNLLKDDKSHLLLLILFIIPYTITKSFCVRSRNNF